jgi:hypothetical protein
MLYAQNIFGNEKHRLFQKNLLFEQKVAGLTIRPELFASRTETTGNRLLFIETFNTGLYSNNSSMYVTKQLISSIKAKPVSNISLQLSDNENKEQPKENDSFFRSDLFYFIGAAALATTFYVVWSDRDKTVGKKTFGTPPKP